MSAYQAIARKWRPQSFADLVGQPHISVTLANALKNGRVHHALLFTGPRGTGKTSSARIFAKSLRCPNAVNFVPCNICDSCLEIAQGQSVDVIEIDGASNNGVDSIRELREGVAFMPTSGKYKIYIIDEVHMLSTSAFNALLKTLEEPPAHVIFIMATTEAHKIPQTILSRCQRFDFRRIATRQIQERLRLICDRDGISADEDALWLIARQGDGSMRDALSLLDQVITFADGDLGKESVSQILGLTDRGLLYETLNGMVHRDITSILDVLTKLLGAGCDPHLFVQDLLESLRNLLMMKVSEGTQTNLVDVADSEIAFLRGLTDVLPEEDIHLLFDMGLKGAADVVRASDPRMVLEVLLLRMVHAPRVQNLKELFTNLNSNNAISPTPEGQEPGMKTSQIPTAGKVTAGNRAGGSNTSSHDRLMEAQALTSVPKGLEDLKQSLEAGKKKTPTSPNRPTLTQQDTVTKSQPQIAPPPPGIEILGTNEESYLQTAPQAWAQFVHSLRGKDGFLAAKLENFVLQGLTNKTFQLAIPTKHAYLRETVTQLEFRKQLQAGIEKFWGPGFTFEIASSKPTADGISAQKYFAKQTEKAESDLRAQIENNPRVQRAQSILQSRIVSISDISQSSQDKGR